MSDKPTLVDFVHPLTEHDLDDVIEWLRSHDADDNINKLAVIIESPDRKIHSRSINLKNKDLAWFLMSEIFDLFETKPNEE